MDRIEVVPDALRSCTRCGEWAAIRYVVSSREKLCEKCHEQPKQLDAEASMREQYRTGTLKYWRWE